MTLLRVRHSMTSTTPAPMQATRRLRLSGDITIPAGVAETGITQAIGLRAQTDGHDLRLESWRVTKTNWLLSSKAMCDGVFGAGRRAISRKSLGS
jgi:hypothetical protein